MLESLEIEGLAVIEKVSLNLHSGLNVLTGETGAGKSVLIRALHLLCGGKASTDTMRSGARQTSVAGRFRLHPGHECLPVLAGLGLLPETTPDPDEDQTLIIRRVVRASGRSSAWINDISVTAGSLRAVGGTLIDIFAQHDNQRLLDESRHLEQLDQFLGKKSAKVKVAKLYGELQDQLATMSGFLKNYAEKKQSRDYLEFRLKDLDELEPSAEDYQNLRDICQSAESGLAMQESMDKVLQTLEQGVGGESLSRALWNCGDQLQGREGAEPDPRLGPFSDRLSGVATELDDLTFDLNRLRNAQSFDAKQFESAQERLARYQAVMRKLQCEDCDTLILSRDRLRTSLDFLDQAEETVSEMLGETESILEKLAWASGKLQKERARIARELEKKIAGEFGELAMPFARLQVELSSWKGKAADLGLHVLGEGFLHREQMRLEKISRLMETHRQDGKDRVRFLMVTNRGEEARPLARIASGGEVSRVMLALKRVLIAEKKTCVMVFDEIDTGISGRVASMVGKKLQEISRQVQVICISHLAQVAAWAGSHYQVRKSGKAGKTWVELISLEGEERVEEMARLLSGEEVTAVSKDNARSLMDVAAAGQKQQAGVTFQIP